MLIYRVNKSLKKQELIGEVFDNKRDIFIEGTFNIGTY